jgi:hypothetical protein
MQLDLEGTLELWDLIRDRMTDSFDQTKLYLKYRIKTVE